ncbi:hemoblobin-interacting domain-containing protein [Fusibacter sp. JL298sf-3]
MSDYGKAVRAVEISGVSYTPETLGITGSTTALDVAPFMSIGAQTVVLKADGYEDQTFAVTVKKGQGLVRFIQSDSLVYGDALTVSRGEAVRLALGDSKKSYKDIVTDVSLDGKRLSSGYMAEETVGYGTHYVLTVDAAQLETGVHTLVVQSEYYEDVVLTLDVTEEKAVQ